MELKTIRVYGRLRKFLGFSYFEAAVSSPGEAIRFLLCNFPEVENHMNNQSYKIKMNNLDISLDYLFMKGQGDIQIIPIATGSIPAVVGLFSAGAAVVSTAASAVGAVAGAAIAGAKAVGGAALAVGGAIAAEYGTTGILGAITTATVNSLAIQGITSLIAPTPPTFEGASMVGDNDAQMVGSYSFSGIQNVSVSGVSVPIIYGEVFTGSIVISSGVDTVQVEGTV